MKTTIVTAESIQATCPHCKEPFTDAATGSFLIVLGEDVLPADGVLTCEKCERKSRLPRRVSID